MLNVFIVPTICTYEVKILSLTVTSSLVVSSGILNTTTMTSARSSVRFMDIRPETSVCSTWKEAKSDVVTMKSGSITLSTQ